MRNYRLNFDAIELLELVVRWLIGAAIVGWTAFVVVTALWQAAVRMEVRTNEEECGALYTYWAATRDDSTAVAFTFRECAVFALPSPPAPPPQPR